MTKVSMMTYILMKQRVENLEKVRSQHSYIRITNQGKLEHRHSLSKDWHKVEII